MIELYLVLIRLHLSENLHLVPLVRVLGLAPGNLVFNPVSQSRVENQDASYSPAAPRNPFLCRRLPGLPFGASKPNMRHSGPDRLATLTGTGVYRFTASIPNIGHAPATPAPLRFSWNVRVSKCIKHIWCCPSLALPSTPHVWVCRGTPQKSQKCLIIALSLWGYTEVSRGRS